MAARVAGGFMRPVELAGLTGKDLTAAHRDADGGMTVTIRRTVKLRWDSVEAFAEWSAMIDDLVWGLIVNES